MNLVDAYCDNEHVRFKCTMLVTLAFAPAGSIVAAFETIQYDISEEEIASLDDNSDDTCIGRVCVMSIFAVTRETSLR